MKVDDHEILSSEPVYDGKVVKLFRDRIRLPDGREATWERIVHQGAVGIVPLLENGNILLVRQYRNAPDDVLLEIPAGKLEPGEAPDDCADREIVEEVNMRAGELIKLSEFYNSPGYSDEYFHLYLATDLTPEQGETEEDEFLEIEEISLNDALGMVSDGHIVDAKSVMGVALARLYLDGVIPAFRC